MGDRKKIHIFLGAPPTSSDPALVSEAGVEHPPVCWSHLELTWQGRQLLPAAEEGSDYWRVKAGQSICSDDEENAVQDDWSFRNDWTKETSQAREIRATSGGKFNRDVADFEKSTERLLIPDEKLNSVYEYLDSAFPAAQPDQAGQKQPPHCSKHPWSPAASPLSVQSQYLNTWTLSQALILRSRLAVQSATRPLETPTKNAQTTMSVSSSAQELFSPVTPTTAASAEVFRPPRPTQLVEAGGVILEATSVGVLCSQEAESFPTLDSPITSPDLNKNIISKDVRTEAMALSRGSGGLRGPTTLLVQCDKPGVRYQVLVAAVYPCHLKEIRLKSGPSAGTLVPLASIVVTDQSAVEKKVVLWRRAGFWALTVSPGDILLITGLQVNVDRWRGETVLQSTFSSKLLNLGQITASTSPPAPQHVHVRSLSSLCGYLREDRPLLVSLSVRPLEDLTRLPYATLRSLRVNTLVHALLRVTNTHISTEWRREAESGYRSALQQQAILTVEQPGGQQGVLLLWGTALEWLPRFNSDKAAVWDVRVLLVREGSTYDLPELHSSPWSSVQLLQATDRRARDFLLPQQVRTGNSSSVELDLDTLLSQKYSGDVELRVQAIAFQFQDSLPSQNAPQLVLNNSTSLAGIFAVLSGDIIYTGCGHCTAELDTDANGIYSPCYPCLPHTAVRRYYRPAVLTVRGQGNNQVCVQVPSLLLQNILDAPPDKLHRSSAPGSDVKHIQLAAEKIQTLLFLPRTSIITVRSLFLCDENSVPVTQDFTLLDLKFPT